MRFWLGAIAVVALLVGGGYYYFQQRPEALPQQAQLKQFEALKETVQDVAERAKQRFSPSANVTASPQGEATSRQPDADASPLAKFLHSVAPAKPTSATAAPVPPANQATLYLVNGGMVTGELVSETPQEVTLRFEYGEVEFRRAEIKRFVKGKEGTGEDNLNIPWENVIPPPKPKAPPDSSEDR